MSASRPRICRALCLACTIVPTAVLVAGRVASTTARRRLRRPAASAKSAACARRQHDVAWLRSGWTMRACAASGVGDLGGDAEGSGGWPRALAAQLVLERLPLEVLQNQVVDLRPAARCRAPDEDGSGLRCARLPLEPRAEADRGELRRQHLQRPCGPGGCHAGYSPIPPEPSGGTTFTGRGVPARISSVELTIGSIMPSQRSPTDVQRRTGAASVWLPVQPRTGGLGECPVHE
jgi:hypothetical protein